MILWGDQPVEVASDALGQDFRVETKLYAPDILERAPGRFHVLVNGRSLRLRLIDRDSDGLVMECNGRRYKVGIKTTLEQLLDKMGVATVNNRGPAKVQAPMPGLVLRVLTQVGAVVAPGDPLIVLESMKRTGIDSHANDPIRDLSGGQQQRTHLAQVLARQAEVLLLDEPTAGLDLNGRQAVADLIATERARGVTVVLATHELADAESANAVMLLAQRVVALGAPSEALRDEYLRECFGFTQPP